MNFMSGRFDELEHTLLGLQKTGVPLIACYDGHFTACGSGDDLGAYYLIPKIALMLNVPLHQAVNLFYGAIVIVALLAATVGAMLLFQTKLLRTTAFLALLVLSGLSFYYGDVYIVTAAIPMVLVPWLLYLVRRPNVRLLACFCFGLGIILQFANIFRLHSGTAPLIFAVIVLWATYTLSWRARTILPLVILAGMGLSWGFFQSAESQRDRFLRSRTASYSPPSDAHAIWHSVYIGFGFLGNPWVPEYSDAVAIAKVKSISPKAGFVSPEYHRILQAETLRFIRQHPRFVAWTVFVKISVILMYLLLGANYGLLAAIRCRRPQVYSKAFWAALSFSSLNGILTYPRISYLLGFLTFAVLYGLVSIQTCCGEDSLTDGT